jgi:hypothetical protein
VYKCRRVKYLGQKGLTHDVAILYDPRRCGCWRSVFTAPGVLHRRGPFGAPFEVRTQLEVLKPAGTTLVWQPAALIGETPYQKTWGNQFRGQGGRVRIVESQADRLGIVTAVFPAGVKRS